MFGDLLIALRGLRRSPAFTFLAVATLALGIGANATIFSIVDSVLLRPLAGFETDRLLRIQDSRHAGGLGFLDPEAFKSIRTQARTFEQLSGMQFCQFVLTGGAEPEQVWGPCVTSNWFAMQRAKALLGRTFLPTEDQPGHNRVAVLDHGFWQRRYGGDRNIVGQTILLDHSPWVVIGVMPPEFRPIGANASSIFTPYVLDENAAGLYVTGRLIPGVTAKQASAELDVLATRMRSSQPRFKDLTLKATSVLEDITGPAAPMLRLLLGAVSMVLLIACVNVANLLLARAGARQREMDIRAALGASRWQIARFLFAEALWLCLAASVAAFAMASAGLRLARPLLTGLPRADEITVDHRVFAACLLIGILTAAVFGILPSLLPGRSARRWQGSLVAMEVALAFVLLSGCGLLLRTFTAMRSTNLGYDPSSVLTYFYSLPPSADGSRAAGLALFARLRDRIAGIPGVVETATASTLPMGGVTITMDVQPEGQPASRNARQAALAIVSGNYFRAARIPLLAGRAFGPGDREGATPTAIVSQSIANRYFGGKAVGRRLILPHLGFNLTGGGDARTEIVGVAGNVCVNSVSDCEVEHIYLPEAQNALRMSYFVIRTSGGDPLALAGSVKRAAAEESPVIPFDEPQTLQQRAGYLTETVQRGMWLIGVFAALALVLAAIGIYGVSSYLAGLRRKEMGIRLALGATAAGVAALVFRQTLTMALMGLAAGALAGAWLSRFLESMLFKTGPRDPATLAIATVGLVLIALVAAAPAALRSGALDVVAELRRDS